MQPAFEATMGVGQKFHPVAENGEKIRQDKNSPRHGRYANAALHNCHDSPILAAVEDQFGA
ncbi:hypothetical protein EN943_12400 [Mesorhizobium sp. M7A.F.Ca.US.006.01.1.1]|uniref:hypothetical protein n=1 Tax=Mesorhizobium sp. M7A.F.Ca.US.006.01.1.1 TaxID=2496707 RepID=UPI000FCCA7B2|nr:hypothetical protein [Mesorhizobium sp. M7A.F.Ca.US.006.01.1.1]RUZ77919.1 hypothetical protein EN943_12400 [Mesorhizobium sp. M7A.F.Ca.US.006.01.1.1]